MTELNAKDEPTLHRREDRRLATAVLQGLLLSSLVVAFRLTKVRVLHLDPGLADGAGLLLPEIGSVALLESLFILSATRLRSRLAEVLWWSAFVFLHTLAYAVVVLEHTFFLHTGIRLDLDLVDYALANFAMLQGLIAYGVDQGFLIRIGVAVAFLVLGILAGRWLRLPLRRSALPPALLAGLLLLVLPPSAPVRSAGLGTTTLGGFLRAKPGFEEEAQRAMSSVVPPERYYAPPQITGPAERQPNIVLLILESTRTDVTPPYAPPERWSETPALAALAADSVVFDQTYSTVTHTSKALVGILCGMFPRQAMPIFESLEHNLPLRCLPHLLPELGYRTAFLQTAMGRFENRPGLVRNLGFQQAAFQETLTRPGFGTTGYLGLDELAMVDPALEWIEGGGPEPFFLTLLTLSTHHPYQVPGQPLTTAVREHPERYREAIRHQDRFVGALVEGLRARGRLDDTVLIVLGDHGEAFGEHRRLQHDIVPYQEVVHVPLLIRAPWLLGEARRAGGLRHQIDLLPSVLALLGAPWEGTLPGRDLFAEEGHERVFSSCWFTNTCLAMREGDHKWIFHYGLRPTELFDLAADPGETHNLAPTLDLEEVHAAEERILGFRLTLDAWWAQYPPQTTGGERWWQEAAPAAGP